MTYQLRWEQTQVNMIIFNESAELRAARMETQLSAYFAVAELG